MIALPYDTGELLVRELFVDEFWFVAREDDPQARNKTVPVNQLDPDKILLLEEGHCLRDHAIAACKARAPNEPGIEATSLNTLVQMVEGGMGVTLLPEMTLNGGILKGTHLISRPFASQVPSRTVALVARPSSARRGDFDLLADFIIESREARAEARAHCTQSEMNDAAASHAAAAAADTALRLQRLRHLRILWRFVAPYRWQMIGAAVALVIAAGCFLVIGQGLKRVIDMGFLRGDRPH